MLEIISGILFYSFVLLAEMAPYLLLGLAAAGFLHVVIPMGMVSKYLGGSGVGSAFRAAVIGVPLPLCSCGVVPVAASLKKSGASKGAVVSFLITTPTSGVDSILATYSLLGPAIMAARLIFSFLIGLVAGILTAWGSRSQSIPSQGAIPVQALTSPEKTTVGNSVRQASAYALGELLGGIAGPLTLGILLGGTISFLLPEGFIQQTIGKGWVSYFVMLAFGIPLYVCASGSIPLAAALLLKGISPGAALVFLISGPATNAATVGVILQILGKRGLFFYLLLLITGSLAAGFATDALFASFPVLIPEISQGLMAHESHIGFLQIISGTILGALTLGHLIKRYLPRLSASGGPKMAMTTLKVQDMSCQHCVRSIKNAVSPLSGVRSVEADPATKLVHLDLDNDADQSEIMRAISDAGFHPEPLTK